ncbi:phospholipase A2 inhibitor beta-like [Branchiostoma lanceolatum]|uniref:phospholipase A2 inhibitor beta-like n=1 Tax=Branchiostoma lanceolatum TaxID=7740 RepID=UPI003455F289
MARPKTSIFVVLLMLGSSQACPSCERLCPRRHKIGCGNPYRGQERAESCHQRVDCNVTGSNCSNQELSSCLQDGVHVLKLIGHYDSNGTLNHLPTLPMLESLLLSGGHIRDIRNGAFATFASLRLLSLNGNSVQVVGIWFEGLEALEKLQLCRNEIKNVKRGAFRSLENLQSLDMSHNRICSIEAWFFEGLSSLLELDLNHNEISNVSANAFDLIPIRKRLDLSHNMLQTLSPGWLQILPPRVTVHLNSNLLPTIRHETIMALRGKFVFAWGNPFRCTCASLGETRFGAPVLRLGKPVSVHLCAEQLEDC